MGVKNKHGAYNYKIYDAKTNKLLAEGIGKNVAKVMGWDSSYPNSLAQLNKKSPNRRVRYERVEREWVDTIYEIFDTHTEQKIIGTYDDCSRQINNWLGKELTPGSMKNYIYRCSRRFKVRRVNNV